MLGEVEVAAVVHALELGESQRAAKVEPIAPEMDRSGHLGTDEIEDRAGMLDRLPALRRPVMLEGGAAGMRVGIPGRDVNPVEDFPLLDERGFHGDRQLAQEPGDRVTQRLLVEGKVQGLDRLLGGLLCREAGPFVSALHSLASAGLCVRDDSGVSGFRSRNSRSRCSDAS